MKRIITLLIGLLPLTALAAGNACQKQVIDLEKKMEMAKKLGNRSEISRLNIAINRAKTRCNDTSQQRNIDEYENQVNAARLELKQAKQELENAQATKRAGLIASKSQIYDQKKRRLETAEKTLAKAKKIPETTR